MRYIKLFTCFSVILFQANAQQPTIKILESGKRVSIRGLSVVNDNIIWASGSSGSVARSTNGGNTFTWQTIPGYEKRDFRDIEAFDENTAIIMGIAEPAIILKTKDGGKNWYKVFEDTTKGMFLDAMDFNDGVGIVIGDPIKDRIFMASTTDNGDHWNPWHERFAASSLIETDGEAFFASSGTNLKICHNGLLVVSGGKASNLYNWYDIVVQKIPIMKGSTSTGANSISFNESIQRGIIVGGDFAKDTISTNNCALFRLSGDSAQFILPSTPPHGYRSCVIYLDEKNLLTCGTSGIDISKDGGMNWELISKESYHVCQKAKKGNAVFLAGGSGRIAKLVYP